MGREIRRVPFDWQHPRDENNNYIGLMDTPYIERAREWLDECVAWNTGAHETLKRSPELKDKYPFFWQWEDPPNPTFYRPEYASEPTAYQVYETVSEGTPVSPVFATAEELVDHLVDNGTDYDPPMSRDGATRFVSGGWAPSMIITPGRGVQFGLEAMSDGAL